MLVGVETVYVLRNSTAVSEVLDSPSTGRSSKGDVYRSRKTVVLCFLTYIHRCSFTQICVHIYIYINIYNYIYIFICIYGYKYYICIQICVYIYIFKLGWLHVPRKPLLPLPLRWTQWQKHPQGCAFFRWCIGRSDRRLGPSGDNSEIPPFPVVLFIFGWKNFVLLTFLGNFYWNINSVIFENGFYSYLTCFSCLKFAAHLNDYSTIFCATKVSLRAITTF